MTNPWSALNTMGMLGGRLHSREIRDLILRTVLSEVKEPFSRLSDTGHKEARLLF
jgi:hypothetical protein